MRTIVRRSIASLLALALTHASVAVQAAPGPAEPPRLIGAEEVAARQEGGRALLESTLARADVAAALEARGVSLAAARDRVAALTDDEAALVAAEIDRLPAGAESVIGTLVFIFVLLLITDILGFTKIFPFTRSIR
jgi:hypothetical protein